MARHVFLCALILSVLHLTMTGTTTTPSGSTTKSQNITTTTDGNSTTTTTNEDTTTTNISTTTTPPSTTTTPPPTTTPFLYNCSDACLDPPTPPPCINPTTSPTYVTSQEPDTTTSPCNDTNFNCTSNNVTTSCNGTDADCMNATDNCNNTSPGGCVTPASTSEATSSSVATEMTTATDITSSNLTTTTTTTTELTTSSETTSTSSVPTTTLPICNTSDDTPTDSCDRLTGHCLYGCPDKDLAGPFCNMSCFNNGVYNCEKCGYDVEQSTLVCEQCSKNFHLTAAGKCVQCPNNCRAYNSSTSRCKHDDGTCDSGCRDGYFGIGCDRQCDALCSPRVCTQFGGCCSSDCHFDTHCGCQCKQPCNSNCLSKTCNADCTCKGGCLHGYYGPTCNIACSSNCVSLNGSADTCNATNGHCYYGCVNDTTWTGICEESCSEGCINNTCDQYSGECIDGCINDEWHDQDCSKKCSRTCDDQRCVREDGTCLLGCVPGQWGDYCESPCSKNCRNQTCDRYNETCTDGCTDGFYDRLCNRNCSVNCLHNVCNFTTGFCSYGCKGCYLGDVCDEACPDTMWIYVAIGCGAFVVIVIPIMILFGKRWRQKVQHRKSMALLRGDVEPKPFRKKVRDNVKSIVFAVNPEARHKAIELKKTMSRLDRETILDAFITEGAIRCINEFQKLPEGLLKPHEYSKDFGSLMKNFYNGIYAYDKNRVKINQPPASDDSLEFLNDYINASYIHGHKSNRRYIAAQGPSHVTAQDFWRMIGQEKVGLIVMMTVIPQDGFSQIEKYWPDCGDADSYDSITVKTEMETVFSDFIIREFKLTVDGKASHVTQLQFLRWSDAGHLPNAVEMAEFFHKYRSMIFTMTTLGPIVVHCTDGSERTGYFIALDIAVSELADEESVDVLNIVQELREQRVNMVGRQNVYGFLYEVLVHCVTFGLELISRDEYDRAYKRLQNIREKDGLSNIRKVYEDLQKTVSIHKQAIATLNPIQKKRDRPSSEVPDIRFIPELIDVDYINAIQLDTYFHEAGIISTQMPSPQTIEGFCELVLQKDCTTIVMLNQAHIGDTSMCLYWETAQKYGRVCVSINEVTIHPSLVYRRLVFERPLEDADKKRLEVNLLQCTKWNDPAKLPSVEAFLELLLFARGHMIRPFARRLLVHCLNGSDQTGLFCALYNLIEKAEQEQFVNIVSTVHKVMTRRSSTVNSLEQFKFCYEVLIAYFTKGGPEMYAKVNKIRNADSAGVDGFGSEGSQTGEVCAYGYAQVFKPRPETKEERINAETDPSYMLMNGLQRSNTSKERQGSRRDKSEYVHFQTAKVEQEENVSDVQF